MGWRRDFARGFRQYRARRAAIRAAKVDAECVRWLAAHGAMAPEREPDPELGECPGCACPVHESERTHWHSDCLAEHEAHAAQDAALDPPLCSHCERPVLSVSLVQLYGHFVHAHCATEWGTGYLERDRKHRADARRWYAEHNERQRLRARWVAWARSRVNGAADESR